MPLPTLKHPISVTQLPSTGKPIRYRPMVGKEEKILLMAKESGETKDALSAILQVVEACAVTDGFLPRDSAVFDIDWLFIKIRCASVSSTAGIIITDDEDGSKHNHTVELEKVSVLSPKPPDGSERVDCGEKVTVSLRWPRAKLYDDSDFFSSDHVDDSLIASAIDKIWEGDTCYPADEADKKELHEFVTSLPIHAREKIRGWLTFTPRLSYKATYTSASGKEKGVELSTLSDFFELL